MKYFLFLLMLLSHKVYANIIFPKDLFTDQINGQECLVGNSNTDINWIKDLAKINADSVFANDTSLTVNHNQISKRWAELLRITYIAATSNDKELSSQIIDTLVYIANANALLSTTSSGDGQCWAEGDKNSRCLHHTPQHTGFTFIAIIYSAVILREYVNEEQEKILNKYFHDAYKKFIKSLAEDSLDNRGFYEFGDYGLGVLAYANWTNDTELAKKEINRRYKSILNKLEKTGYIYNNSYRGNRAYWYHTLGANSIYGYSLVAKQYGVNFFKDPVLGPRLKNLALKTLEGEENYDLFVSKGDIGNNASKDPNDARTHMHQLAKSLPIILKMEYGINVGKNSRYVSLSNAETVDRFIGFNADCFYSSNSTN
jgi:hypothetical protein